MGQLSQLGMFAKAIYAGILGFLGPLAVVLVGDMSFGEITAGQWVSAVVAGLVSGGGVYQIKNATPASPPAPVSTPIPPPTPPPPAPAPAPPTTKAPAPPTTKAPKQKP